jgi:hypothetical protein
MDEGEFIRHLIEHQDQKALAIKSSSSCIRLYYSDFLKSRGHVTSRQQHTDITEMMGSLLDIGVIGKPFLRERITSTLRGRVQLSQHLSAMT